MVYLRLYPKRLTKAMHQNKYQAFTLSILTYKKVQPAVHLSHAEIVHVLGGFGHVDGGMRLMRLMCTYSVERGGWRDIITGSLRLILHDAHCAFDRQMRDSL